ncbi:cupredoxin domain-containing protein [Candidatus Woesearchaeota archaeon]|nr:cupredoxin domain-containing protein [Candidatus Woesearchaeota archaeon]
MSQESPPLPQTPAVAAEPTNDVMLSWGKFNYKPEVITVKHDEPVTIRADLSRLQGCFRSFEIPALGVSAYFRAGADSVQFTPTKKGTFRFSCSMGMGNGKLVVV